MYSNEYYLWTSRTEFIWLSLGHATAAAIATTATTNVATETANTATTATMTTTLI